MRKLRLKEFLGIKPVGLIAGTMRSGTGWFFRAFRDVYGDLFPTHHEPRWEEIEDEPGLEVGWTIDSGMVQKVRSTYGACIRALHIVRHPREFIRSAFQNNGIPIEEGCRTWYRTHKELLKTTERPWARARVESLWRSRDGLLSVADFFQLPTDEGRAERLIRRWHGNKQNRTTAEVEVPRFRLPKQVVDLAAYFGYERSTL